MRKTIQIDLDGVLNDYDGNFSEEIPKIKKGAKEFLKVLAKINHFPNSFLVALYQAILQTLYKLNPSI